MQINIELFFMKIVKRFNKHSIFKKLDFSGNYFRALQG